MPAHTCISRLMFEIYIYLYQAADVLVNWLMHHAWDSALTCAVIFTQVAPFFYRITFLPTRTFEEQRRHAAWEQDAHVVCPVIRINQMHASQG